MANNYLEQLIAEWYEYKGYFIRRNIYVGKRPKGGYECELDIIAFHPGKNHLVHIEPSMDADSWQKREKRFRKKFEAGRKYIPNLFEGFNLPDKIEQIAFLGFASKTHHKKLAGANILLVPELLEEIFSEMKSKHIASSAISEQQPILRTFQFVAEYWKVINNLMEGKAN